jgi:cytochrome b561
MPGHLTSDALGLQASKVTTINRAFVQLGLYGLMLSQPGSGLGQTAFRGREVVLFVTRIPNLVPADPAMRASFYFAHQFGICLLAILVACQAVVALVRAIYRNYLQAGYIAVNSRPLR